MQLNPYLNFAGNAEEALNFYKDALGGEILQIGRYGESPMPSKEEHKNKVMHARFVFDGNLIRVSDVFERKEFSTKGNITLSVDVEDISKMEEVFGKLSEGGTVTMTLQDTFWGARFGMLVDKFGVPWMFNCELQNVN